MGLLQSVTKPTQAASAQVASADSDADWLLVQRAQAGEMAAFNVLVKKYRERLYSVIYNLTANREDTADLTQDAFVKAFQSIGRFQGRSAFFTWLYRIGVNTALSHLKKNRFRRFLSFETLQESALKEDVFTAMADDSGADKSLFMNELQERLNESLQKLSHKHRTAVVLFEIEGLSHQEIGEIMGCSEGTARSRVHYAKQQLQGLLKDYIQR